MNDQTAKPRPRSRNRRGGGGSKRRRSSSLAWERPPSSTRSERPELPSLPDPDLESTRGSSTPAAERRPRVPEVIARLDAPLHVERAARPIEPRVARRRSIARRAELDSALAELQAFVESTAARR